MGQSGQKILRVDPDEPTELVTGDEGELVGTGVVVGLGGWFGGCTGG